MQDETCESLKRNHHYTNKNTRFEIIVTYHYLTGTSYKNPKKFFISFHFVGRESGITFIPVIVLILYIVHKVSAFSTWTIQQAAYNGDPKYNTTDTNATATTSSRSISNVSTTSTTKTSHLPQSLLQPQQQSYKVGWLRVSRDEQRLPPPDASIGDMVKNIIINGNRNNQQNQIYFAVLKHTTLYLYDSERQLDCKGVIQVNQHKVMTHPPGLHDHELFTRPHLIKLTHKDNKDAHYYINCNKCVDKEDWYFALLRSGYSIAAESTNTSTATITTTATAHSTLSHHEKESSMHFDQDAMNKLLTTIHSDEHHFQTQWFNAMLGRIFCAVYKTDEINAHLYNKLISKLDKINARRPAFLGEITVRSVDPGHAPPFITQPRLLGLSPTGVLTAEAHMQYEGGIRFEIETVLKWKYSEHLRPLTVDLVLAITLKSLKGKFLLKIKEPPTNRFWYGFYELPQMEWLVEPLVWERRVGYSMVVKAIQTKIDELVMENVVLPNLDDITFFPTHGAGGIFGSPTPTASTSSSYSSTTTATTTTPEPSKTTNNNKAPLTTSASLPEFFDKQAEPTKPKMKRWFTSKDTVTTTISDKEDEKEESTIASNNNNHSVTPKSSRPPAKMMTSFSDSAREQKSQRSFIDAILNRKPSQQQRIQCEKRSNSKNNNNDTTLSSIVSSDIPNIPTVAFASSPGASSITSSSASSSTSDPSGVSSDSSQSLPRHQEQHYYTTSSLSPSAFKHTLPIPIITTEFEQYDDSDHDNDTTRARSSSLSNTSTTTSAATAAKEDHQRQLRLRKSASLARMKAKTMASTAVSQINVSPKMHKADELMNQQHQNNSNKNCSDAATVMSSVHQSAVLSSPIEKPAVSIA
ncbi:putative integral membrane protein conserved region-domain-containing protein [Phascolomyces articulosus]|uniref:Integral membrane protein conserved region-domain-containing protein n=1 Tax=Phascolomyces articulosus TaxID=60185 RepID=A0AAD5K012_9FUNG|nr:putative integral membrane protein conserved region-domain-containing protein [Phascolomyces articulosus]